MSDLAEDLRDILAAKNETIDRLHTEVEQAQLREGCAADLAREWEQHCKTAEADRARLRALNAELVEALKMAHPLIGYTGYYPTIMAQVEAAIAKAEKEERTAALDELIKTDGGLL